MLQKILEQYNPKIGEAATAAGTGATAAADTAITGVNDAVTAGGTNLRGAVTGANDFLAPYVGAGKDALTQLSDLMKPGGELNRTPTASEVLAQDPGYQFRMDQASKALEASAAAKGGALGGGTLGALMGLNQNLASSEYGNAFGRLEQSQTDRAARLNQLMTLGYNASNASGQNLTSAEQFLASLGLTGATTAGGFGTNAAQFAGTVGMSAAEQEAANALGTQKSIADLMTGGAAAEAGGVMGSANAWSGALGGLGNAAVGAGNTIAQNNTLATLFKNPAIIRSVPTAGGGIDWRNPGVIYN